MIRERILLSGTGNPALAAGVARELGTSLGACTVERFPDGEVSVRLEQPVRGRDVYLLQPVSPPVDPNLIELLALADAAHRAAAARIVAVVPYLGYTRSDRRHGSREAIAARMVANLLEAAAVDHLVTLDLHTPQIEGFFGIPVDSLTAVPILAAALREHLSGDLVVVAPDAGRVDMASRYAELLSSSMAVLHKKRESGTETRVVRLVGEVEGRTCVLVDDMIATGGTLVSGVEALRGAGGREFVAAATHGLLLDGAAERLLGAGLREIFVTDTVLRGRDRDHRLRVVSVAGLLAGALRELGAGGSLGQIS